MVLFFVRRFFAVYSSSARAADAQKDILGGRTLTTEDKAIIDQKIARLEKKYRSLRLQWMRLIKSIEK